MISEKRRECKRPSSRIDFVSGYKLVKTELTAQRFEGSERFIMPLLLMMHMAEIDF